MNEDTAPTEDFSNKKIPLGKQPDFNQVSTVGREQINPLLLSAKDAARLLGIGSSHFWGLHSSGRLGPMPIKLGRRTLWIREDLEAWVAASCPARRQWQEFKKIKLKAKNA